MLYMEWTYIFQMIPFWKEKCELVCTVKYQLVRLPRALQLLEVAEAGCGVWMPPGGYGRRGMLEAVGWATHFGSSFSQV